MSETSIHQQEELELQTNRADLLNQLSQTDVQEALTAIIANLPKLAEMTTWLTKSCDLAKQAAGDRVLVQDMLGGFKEVWKPVEAKAKHYVSAAVEARHRAEQDESAIGLFGMLRLLKDPELQRGLRFGQAYLAILGERRH